MGGGKYLNGLGETVEGQSVIWKNCRRRAGCPLFLGGNQADPNGITDQPGDIVNVQTVHQLAAMGVDGFHAEIQQVGYLLGRVAFGNQLQNLTLTGRQPI